jgi:molybdopterin converting factor small subunit
MMQKVLKDFIAIDLEEKGMKVTVKFTEHLREVTKTNQIIIDLDEGSHLSDLLEVLAAQYGQRFIKLVYTSEMGPIDSWASVIVDGQAMSPTPQLDVQLKEGSVVVLLAAAGGG